MEKGTGIQLIQQMVCAGRKLRDELEAQFADMDLTVNQAMVIHFTASAQGNVYPKDIETHFQITHPSVSRILRNLESKGYITMEPDPKDGRCKCIALTQQAREKVAQIKDRIACFDQILAQALSGEEKAVLVNLLGKLTQESS